MTDANFIFYLPILFGLFLCSMLFFQGVSWVLKQVLTQAHAALKRGTHYGYVFGRGSRFHLYVGGNYATIEVRIGETYIYLFTKAGVIAFDFNKADAS